MERFELIAPCHFGTEAVLKREIQDLGYQIKEIEDGKVTYEGDGAAVSRSNLFLRTTERILIKIGSFQAETYDELFEGTKALPWENYIPKDGKFWVAKAASIKSSLFSPSDIQSIMKKAIVERLKQRYHKDWFEETGNEYPIRVTILKDKVTIGLDTSGESLHKRGYRKLSSRAPLTETLAAALIMLTPWNRDRLLVDPFCGSGTIPIEAAMLGMDMAPGLNRGFAAEKWTNILERKCWYQAIEEANDRIIRNAELSIQGYDIDDEMTKISRENARLAGVENHIHFQTKEAESLSSSKKYGFVITNPPYGERLEGKENLPALYRQIGEVMDRLDTWSFYILSGYEDALRFIGKRASKNRKIYNGMLQTYFYQFMGPKPPKRNLSK